jgi:hypothetical protein
LLEQEIPGFRTAAAAVPRHSEKNLKDYLFNNGYRNIRVLDPCMDLHSLGRLEHPTPLAYSKRAAATAKINDRMLSQEQEAKRRRESLETLASHSLTQGVGGWIRIPALAPDYTEETCLTAIGEDEGGAEANEPELTSIRGQTTSLFYIPYLICGLN